MDAFSDPSIETVVVMSSAQVGKTEILNNAVGFFVDQDPSPILVVMPTIEAAESWSKERFRPMVRDTASLNAKISGKTRDGGNTILNKTFPGGHLAIAGANAETGLSSRPRRVVLMDEVDRYPLSVEGNKGDPITLATARTETFDNRKILMVSTPGIAGMSRIETEFERSDKRYYHVPCQDCGHKQRLRWEQVQWPKDDPRSAVYVCESCGSAWGDAMRWRAISQGEWVASEPGSRIAGFHLWAAYSTFRPLGDLAEHWCRVQGNKEELKGFVNTRLGESWTEKGEAPDWERIYERREDYDIGTVPMGGLLLTAGVDVQHNRLECSVWAWGENREKWLVEHRVLDGQTNEPDVWADLSSLLDDGWAHASGALLKIERMCVDSGDGARTQVVYNWTRRHPGRAFAVKGVSSNVLLGTPKSADLITGGGAKRKARGVRVYPVGHGIAKLELFGNLTLKRPTDEELDSGEGYPEGYAHLPRVDSEYCMQLCSEQLITTQTRHGYARQEWQKTRERNEALDCYVYARAAAALLRIDRYTDENWANVRDMFGIGSAPVPATVVVSEPARPQPVVHSPTPHRRRGRRNSRSNWM